MQHEYNSSDTHERVGVVAKIKMNPVGCLFDRHDANGALAVTGYHTRMVWRRELAAM